MYPGNGLMVPKEEEEEEEEKEEEEEEEKKEGGSWSLGITAYLFIYL